MLKAVQRLQSTVEHVLDTDQPDKLTQAENTAFMTPKKAVSHPKIASYVNAIVDHFSQQQSLEGNNNPHPRTHEVTELLKTLKKEDISSKKALFVDKKYIPITCRDPCARSLNTNVPCLICTSLQVGIRDHKPLAPLS